MALLVVALIALMMNVAVCHEYHGQFGDENVGVDYIKVGVMDVGHDENYQDDDDDDANDNDDEDNNDEDEVGCCYVESIRDILEDECDSVADNGIVHYTDDDESCQ